MISHLEDLHLDDEYDDEDEQALSVVHVIPGRWVCAVVLVCGRRQRVSSSGHVVLVVYESGCRVVRSLMVAIGFSAWSVT